MIPTLSRLTALILLILTPSLAQAYIGPGPGISAIGTFLALIAAVAFAIVGFLWYPIKRMLKGRKKAEPDSDMAEGE
ncbi:MAG: hypothetical protein AAF908_06125 [Pseudomonadota bacterium]